MNVKNSLVYGVGINDYPNKVFIDKKIIYEYDLWKSMIRRCYSKCCLTRRPTYQNCYVEAYLLSFNNFYNFIHTLKGFMQTDDKGKKFHLDKDLLGGGKAYDRKSICFVPLEINSFLTKNNASRGKYLIGVNFDKKTKTYVSQISVENNKTILGRFNTEKEAFRAYKQAKEIHAKYLANKWKDQIDSRVYEALMNYQVEITD